jgi:hypothetical protein
MLYTITENIIILDYNGYGAYYTNGYKYINILNAIITKSRPTSVSIAINSYILTCENEIYLLYKDTNTNVYNIKLITKGIGLEKENKNSIISTGGISYIYNEKGVYSITGSFSIYNIVAEIEEISKEIDKYLYKQNKSNILSINKLNNELYIPINPNNINKIMLYVLDGDYNNAIENQEYNKYYAIYDITNKAYRIYGYISNINNNYITTINNKIVGIINDTIAILEDDINDGENNCIARFHSKTMSYTGRQSIMKLDKLAVNFQHNLNKINITNNIDYCKISIIINGGIYVWSNKYGNFIPNNKYDYNDCESNYYTDDINTILAPIGEQFNYMSVLIEFGRIIDNNICNNSIVEIIQDIIDYNYEKPGIC